MKIPRYNIFTTNIKCLYGSSLWFVWNYYPTETYVLRSCIIPFQTSSLHPLAWAIFDAVDSCSILYNSHGLASLHRKVWFLQSRGDSRDTTNRCMLQSACTAGTTLMHRSVSIIHWSLRFKMVGDHHFHNIEVVNFQLSSQVWLLKLFARTFRHMSSRRSRFNPVGLQFRSIWILVSHSRWTQIRPRQHQVLPRQPMKRISMCILHWSRKQQWTTHASAYATQCVNDSVTPNGGLVVCCKDLSKMAPPECPSTR